MLQARNADYGTLDVVSPPDAQRTLYIRFCTAAGLVHSSRHERMPAPVAARFVLVGSEGWFWIRTVGAPRDGDPRDGGLRQPACEGDTFAAAQSRQNSLPSMSCITRHDSLTPSAGSSRTR